MATVVHARDLILQSAAVRTVAASLSISGTSSSFTRLKNSGGTTPANITLTATPSIADYYTTAATYAWEYALSSSPNTFNTIAGTSSTQVITSATYEGYIGNNANVIYKATISEQYKQSYVAYFIVDYFRQADDSYVVVVGGESISVQANSSGVVSVYTNTGGTIQVYKSGVAMNYGASGADTFSVGTATISPAGAVTVAAGTGSGTMFTIPDITGMTSTVESATATYTVTIRGAAGTTISTQSVKRTYTKIRAGAAGTSGTNALSAYLTNESVTVPADSTGGGYSLTAAGGTLKVFSGTTDVTTSSTFNITGGTDGGTAWTKLQNGLTFTINETTGVYSLSGASWTSDVESFTANAVYSSTTISKVYTIAKAKAGTAGTSAQYIVINGEQAFKFLSGSSVPVSTTITLTADLFGGLTTYDWEYYDAGTTAWTNLSGTNTNQTYALAYDNSAWGTAGATALRVRCVSGAYYDEMTIVKLYDGAAGTAGVNGTRTAILDMYKWANTAPTTWPVGTSTYTWATGTFTAPATANGWSLTVPATTAGYTLYVVRQIYADSAATAQSTVTWSATSATTQSYAGANGTAGTNGQRVGFLEVYQWKSTTPTGFPSGTSTYTWSTGSFTAPSTPNGWSLTPGASTAGTTLWATSMRISDNLTTTTSIATWNTAGAIAYAVGYSGSNGTDGTAGTRGTITTAKSIAGTSWVDASANTAISEAGGGAPIQGDVVTLYNSGSSFSETRVRSSGGTWTVLTAFFGGNVIVDGTITAAKINVTNLSAIKANTGSLSVDGTLTVGTAGAVMGGATAYGSGNGWFAGYDGGQYKARFGNPTGARAQWDGSNFSIYDSSNTLIFGSGTNLDWSRVSGVGRPESNANVSGVGGYINSDPMLQSASRWTHDSNAVYYPSFNAGDGLQNAWDKVAGGSDNIYSEAFPVSPSKTYLVESSIYMWAANSQKHYLLVAFFDAAGSQLSGSSYPTGWPGVGSWHYYGLIETSAPAGASRYSIMFGQDATAKIPAAAVTAKVGILGGYSGTASRWSWGGARVREITTASNSLPSLQNNYTENGVTHILRPLGGAVRSNSPGTPGAIKVRLPVGPTDTMMKMKVSVYEYGAAASQIYEIGGYNYNSGGTWIWYNTFATMLGSPGSSRPVYFGHDGTYMCVWIGNPSGTWEYPQVQVSDFTAGYANNSIATWEKGWVLSFDTAAATNVTSTIANPKPGGAFSALDQITSANVSTYIASAAIGWAQIGNLTIDTDGAIKSGKTSYADTTSGYWIGRDSGTPKMVIGSGSNKLQWDGSTLTVPAVATINTTTGKISGLIDGNNTIVNNNFTENNVTHILRPNGGAYFASTATGALLITTPVWAGTSGYLRFKVTVYDVYTQDTIEYYVSSELAGVSGIWSNPDVRVVGGSAATVKPVGMDATGSSGARYFRMCIGEAGTTWGYVTARISDVYVSRENYSLAEWETGWTIGIITTSLPNYHSFSAPYLMKDYQPSLTGPVEVSISMGSTTAIDPREGSIFYKTITAATTFSVTPVVATGFVNSFMLDLTNGGNYTVTWWTGMKWAGGTAPTLTSNGRDILSFFTRDGGTTWNGLLVAKDIK